MDAFVVIVLLVRLLETSTHHMLWLRGHLWWGVGSVFLTECLQALLALYITKYDNFLCKGQCHCCGGLLVGS
jgi:hypothetical protein